MSPLLGVVMKAEIAHDVALMAARTSRLMERRSLKMQEASDSFQGVEELYAVIVQKCLAMGSRLSPNMNQKRKSEKTHYVASGIAGKDYRYMRVCRSAWWRQGGFWRSRKLPQGASPSLHRLAQTSFTVPTP